MFIRFKPANGHEYVLLVENFRECGRVRQRTIINFGRRERVEWNIVRRELARMPGFAYLGLGAPEAEPDHHVVQSC